MNCVIFWKCRALALISGFFNDPQPVQPEFLHREAAHHRAVDHRAAQRGIVHCARALAR